MTIRSIPLASIDAGHRLRAIDPSWVTLLAQEITVDGLLQPIRVVERGDGFKLVDGARRLAAFIELDRTEIEADVQDASALADDAAVRLGEIKGNMLRGDLTALDRAVYITAWCNLFQDANGTAKRGRKPAKSLDPAEREEMSATLALNWTEAAQAALRIGRRTIFRSQNIAAIDATLRNRISLLPVANKQNELLLLAEQSEPKQTAIVDMLTAEPATALSVADAILRLDGTPQQAVVAVYERLNEKLSALKPAERERLYELRADEIEIWLARRKATGTRAKAA